MHAGAAEPCALAYGALRDMHAGLSQLAGAAQPRPDGDARRAVLRLTHGCPLCILHGQGMQ